MEECHYSYYRLWHYFQLTKSGYFQIIGKRKGQWRIVFKKKVSIDPLKYCETYKTSGCSHVDGYLCNMNFTLQELFNYCNNKIKVVGNIYETPKLYRRRS